MMTDNNDDDFNNETPLDKALEAAEDFDEEVDLDPHLKRSARHLKIATDEIETAMRKRRLLPIGRH
ncbi:hypothetical protein [Flavivirga jejuensis]|uniref:Uncharacterized protein n=1 Tax=Flavivirga jejuensis TaxID=870487 RepID=A0ABT8WR13_9FLAO|nr:hypothetical protein [Flavivirga jejuensis]MDO5975604.1 hypothetical protein [Flavivirga jejuensis]